VIRRVLAVTMVGGALGLGALGLASAAGASTPAPQKTVDCSKAPNRLAQIAKAEARITAALPRAQARLAHAQQVGNTARAQAIQARITAAQDRQSQLAAAQQRINTACPGVTAA
jgi:hypothetical protein